MYAYDNEPPRESWSQDLQLSYNHAWDADRSLLTHRHADNP
jgi:hypothetical protein